MLWVYYLYSVLFFMIIDCIIINMFCYTLWTRVNEIDYAIGNDSEKRHSDATILFFAFAVPVVRLCITCVYLYLATCSEESFDRLLEGLKEANSNRQ